MAWGMGLFLDIFGPSHDAMQRHAETTTEMPHLGLRMIITMAADMLSSDWMHAISIHLARTAPFLRQIKVWLRPPVRGCQLTLKKEMRCERNSPCAVVCSLNAEAFLVLLVACVGIPTF